MSSLDSLPSDILYLICTHLCRHCHPPSVLALVNQGESPDVASSQAALVALCSTSRCLRDVAQTFLWHAPTIRDHGRFVRAVMARPDLALHTRYLPGRRWLETPTVCRYPEDLALCKRVAQMLFLELPFDPDFNDACRGDDGVDYFFTQLLVSLLPRVEIFYVDTRLDRGRDYVDWHRANFYNLEWRFDVLEHIDLDPASRRFPNLRTVIIDGGDTRACRTMSLIGLVTMLSAATNLRCLVLFQVRGFERHPDQRHLLPPSLQQVRELVLDEFNLYIDPTRQNYRSLENLIRLCPALQAFTLRPLPSRDASLAKGHHLSRSRLLDSLLPASETLTSLTIRLSHVRVSRWDFMPGPQPAMLQFPCLTTLVLDEQFFCRHWLPAKFGGYADDQTTCLTELLPQTMTLLGIRLHHKFRALNDVCHLGKEVATGMFPALQRVEIDVLNHVRSRPNNPAWARRLGKRLEAYRESARQAFDGTSVQAHIREVLTH
ncbi:hypothetical protein HRG_001945 [Hirsutella rhossiliensis]|uniref:Uncharacterized protein n=1 Tax=Hirsutella rhossiliensis TaxID=111463 RepID=A0A9P8N5V6_9HYPO|nr:uncharacterized protein HRG_01945 [Hirsutella rhossiliensis]KAH0966536.1 hypothetical protein HRG_01945 [Hirsutella rhossiliensis]